MSSFLSYDLFVTTLDRLRSWNPDSEYLLKDLTTEGKPQKDKSCWGRFKACLFKKSKSHEVVSAALKIERHATHYYVQLFSDKKTLKTLEEFNKKVEKNLIKANAPHYLKIKKNRNELQSHCKSIAYQCKSIRDELALKTKSSSSASSSSSSSLSSHSFSSLNSTLSVKPPKAKPAPVQAKPSPKAKPAPVQAKPSPKAKPAPVLAKPLPKAKPAPTKPNSNALLKGKAFKSPQEIKNCIAKINPSSAKEARILFAKLEEALTKSKLSKILDQENANALLIKISEIKDKFIDSNNKNSEPELRKAILNLRVLIRKQFFANRIKLMNEQVKLIENNIGNLRQGSIIPKIIEEWKKDLREYKPISIPKYYHSTKPGLADLIIQDKNGIVAQPQGLTNYPGAFVSSIPEIRYGPFCFALSDHIEENAIEQNKAPIVTNLNFDSNHYVPKEPIYIGKTPNVQKDASKHIGQPRLWLGFQQNILMQRPKKKYDPLGYYKNTTFSLFTQANHQSPISDPSLAILKKRKIKVLSQEDFNELVDLVERSLYFVLPKAWGDDVTAPDFCKNIEYSEKHIQRMNLFLAKHGYQYIYPTRLKDIRGVVF